MSYVIVLLTVSQSEASIHISRQLASFAEFDDFLDGQTLAIMITVFSAVDPLADGCAALFAAAQRQSFHCTEAWLRLSIAHALPAGAKPFLALYTEQMQPTVMFSLRTANCGAPLASLTNVYTCLWQPLISPDADTMALQRAGRAFGKFFSSWPTIRLDAMDAALPEFLPLLCGMRDAGLLAQRFDHFGNWHQSVAGWSWQDYLASRPGTLRETIRRKLGQSERNAEMQFELLNSPDHVDSGTADYECVYAGSWKLPEPFPRFNPALIRAAANLGVLRLGLLRQNGKPIAAQVPGS